MHEIRVTVPAGEAHRVARIALQTGIPRAKTYSVFTYGPDQQEEVISVEVSTPQAKAFVDALVKESSFDSERWSISSRELRAILTRKHPAELTRPMVEPTIDVFEDLWQLSHVTPSYIARALGGGILLAYGMLKGHSIPIVVAALFLPFLAQVLAISYGSWLGDWALARQGFKAIFVSTLTAFLGGLVVAALSSGPVRFDEFQTPLISFGISSVIGVAAGLSSADDTGRRYLIGVAAAVQFAVFPAWFGLSVMRGFESATIAVQRLETFVINLVTIAGVAVLSYASLRMKKEEVTRFVQHTYGDK